MVCFGMQSPGCATIGQQLGQCNISKAKEYFRAVVSVFGMILVFEVFVFWQFQYQIINFLTSIEDLKDCIDQVYPMFLINIVFSGFNGMLRGPIYALGLMKQLSKYNLIFQGLVMPLSCYYLFDYGMQGLWISKNLIEVGLLISYSITLLYINWHEIAYGFMRQRVQDSNDKNMQPEELELKHKVEKMSGEKEKQS